MQKMNAHARLVDNGCNNDSDHHNSCYKGTVISPSIFVVP